MSIQKLILLFTFILLLTACGPSYVFEQEIAIENNQWTYADSLAFRSNIVDTSGRYNLYLDIQHNQAYPFQNLYVMIKTLLPSGKEMAQQVSLEMMDKTGLWYGKCSGESCDLRVVLQENTYFREPGDYEFKLQQYMRRDSLSGIENLAFRIEKVK